MNKIFIPHTYTYDQFTVFFYGDRIFVGENDFLTGQCSVDMMNLAGRTWTGYYEKKVITLEFRADGTMTGD